MTGKGEVVAVGKERVAFNEERCVSLTREGIVAGDFALGGTVYEGFDEVDVFHGSIGWRGYLNLVFKQVGVSFCHTYFMIPWRKSQ